MWWWPTLQINEHHTSDPFTHLWKHLHMECLKTQRGQNSCSIKRDIFGEYNGSRSFCATLCNYLYPYIHPSIYPSIFPFRIVVSVAHFIALAPAYTAYIGTARTRAGRRRTTTTASNWYIWPLEPREKHHQISYYVNASVSVFEGYLPGLVRCADLSARYGWREKTYRYWHHWLVYTGNNHLAHPPNLNK